MQVNEKKIYENLMQKRKIQVKKRGNFQVDLLCTCYSIPLCTLFCMTIQFLERYNTVFLFRAIPCHLINQNKKKILFYINQVYLSRASPWNFVLYSMFIMVSFCLGCFIILIADGTHFIA